MPSERTKIPIIRPTLVDFDEVQEAFREVWDSGIITLGKYTALFEREVENQLGVRHAIAVSSCTSGLMLALKALDLSGEVIVPSFTFTATAHAIVWNGLTPVFCDCQPGTYNIDPVQMKTLITDRTCAIMPVYTFGLPPDIDELEAIAKAANLRLVFDAAQGLGASYKGRMAGGFGDVEVFSLSPTKVVTAVEGGMVTTNDANLAMKIRSMRDYGKCPDREDIAYVGLSARMSELHAIVGRKNLEKMHGLIARRKKLIQVYKDSLRRIPSLAFQDLPTDRATTGNYMVIFVDEPRAGLSRNEVHLRLLEKGVETKKYFFPPVHLQKAYQGYRSGHRRNLSITEKAARNGLALPLYSHMKESDVRSVCKTILAEIRGPVHD